MELVEGKKLIINAQKVNTEVWAQLHLSSDDCARLRAFLAVDMGISRKYILRHMHITIYYARRPLPGLNPGIEPTQVVIPASETRFMVMAPGGENPRCTISPAENMVGIRLHRQCSALTKVAVLRERLIQHETRRVLGSRNPSTIKTSAFGARSFQPHMVMLRPGSDVHQDLTKVGQPFREKIGNLLFDKFEIKIVHRDNMQGSYKRMGN